MNIFCIPWHKQCRGQLFVLLHLHLQVLTNYRCSELQIFFGDGVNQHVVDVSFPAVLLLE